MPAGSNDTTPDHNNMPIKKATNSKLYRVLYSYTPTHSDELMLRVDDVVEFIEESEEGWFKGRINGKTGVFPSNFVEVYDGIGGGGGGSSGGGGGEGKKRNSVHGGKKKHSSGHNSQDEDGGKKLSDETLDNDAPKLPPKPLKEVARVMYSYDAQNDDELSLKEGEIVNVLSKDVEDKGWWRGEINGKVGVFPDNFVEIIQHNEVNHRDRVDNSGREKIPKGNSFGLNDNVDGKIVSKARVVSVMDRPTSKKENHSHLPKMKHHPLSAYEKEYSNLLPRHQSFPQKSPTTDPYFYHYLHSTPSILMNGGGGILRSSKKDAPKKNNRNQRNSHLIQRYDEADFDDVQRSEMLSHPTASRVKAPKRRPPSSVLGKETEHDFIMNGNTEIEEEVEESPKMSNNIEHKEAPKERKTIPWMEELKTKQTNRVSRNLTPGSRDENMRPPSPSRRTEDQIDKKVPPLPIKPSHVKQEESIDIPNTPPKPPRKGTSSFFSDESAWVPLLRNPAKAKIAYPPLPSSGISSKPKYPSPPIINTSNEIDSSCEVSSSANDELISELKQLKEANERLTSQVRDLQTSMEVQHTDLKKKLKTLLDELEHEKTLRISVEKKLESLL